MIIILYMLYGISKFISVEHQNFSIQVTHDYCYVCIDVYCVIDISSLYQLIRVEHLYYHWYSSTSTVWQLCTLWEALQQRYCCIGLQHTINISSLYWLISIHLLQIYCINISFIGV